MFEVLRDHNALTEADVRTTLALGFACLVCSAGWAADSVRPLDVKTGLWEASVTTESSGIPPIPPELLAKLTPEQRAKFEERAKAAQGAKTTQQKHCLKKEELDKPLDFGNNGKSCTRTIVTSTSSKQEFRIACGTAAMKTNGTVKLEALDSENVKCAITMSVTDGTRTMTGNSTFSAKWVAPVCPATDGK